MTTQTQWEYRIVTAHIREDEGGMTDINTAGREGWEAVSASPSGRLMFVLLKRAILRS